MMKASALCKDIRKHEEGGGHLSILSSENMMSLKLQYVFLCGLSSRKKLPDL